MEHMLSKFGNSNWLYKIIFIAMGALGIHIKFLSRLMGI